MLTNLLLISCVFLFALIDLGSSYECYDDSYTARYCSAASQFCLKAVAFNGQIYRGCAYMQDCPQGPSCAPITYGDGSSDFVCCCTGDLCNTASTTHAALAAISTPLMTYQSAYYGTYPGKRTELSHMMQSQDTELVPLDGNSGSPMRSILRNKETPAREFYDIYDPYGTGSSKTQSQTFSRSKSQGKCRKFLERIVRPCVAEFISVVISVIVYFHIESQLLQRHVTFFNKIIILSVVDCILYTVFFATFQTVHINPSISIAQLFTLTTSWTLCILLIIVQFLAVGAGTVLFYFFNSQVFPNSPTIIQDLTQDWTKGVYEMVVCQAIGTTMVVISNLLSTKRCSHGKSSWRRLNRSPLCVSSAVGLASLLSLLHSNVSWNSMYIFVMILLEAFHGKGFNLVFNHLLFWLGPLVGSLLGSILFKLLFAPQEQKPQNTDGDH
ncbi:hypothetical protein FO519_002122 [Halicephalobus sp. NKZ332]|nr:hypothetical protein FO519_002122 [Halicephalobus sp. NKZ332]